MFQWGGKQQKAFDTLKEKISTTPVLALPDLQRPFEIETDASDYAMGVVLMQHGKPICYHLETFNSAVVNYPTYDKELYALVQSVKKWKHYLMGKETIIHTDHQLNCSNQGIIGGWVSYNIFILSSDIRRAYTIRL